MGIANYKKKNEVMGGIKKIVLIVLLPLVAFTTAHKFYVSVTNIKYSEKDESLQITSRIFIDDLEKVLEERYTIEGNLATEEESEIAMAYIEKYIRAKFSLKIDGETRNFNFLGRKYDQDIMVCYLEIPKVNISNVKSMEVQNEILTDLYGEQQNVVHFKLKGKKKSFVLIRENYKGMLNL